MQKAYDRIEWSFLKAILHNMGFSTNWIHWVMLCVSTMSYRILINSSPSKTIVPSRGLRQGDPLSPYLFILCANVLSCALIRNEQNNNIKGIRIGRNCPTFTHLFFADDSLLFFKDDSKTITTLQQTLNWYCDLSGQKFNAQKSELFCTLNISPDRQQAFSSTLGVKLVNHLGKY